MKKYIKIIVVLILITLVFVFYKLTSSNSKYYSTIESYIKDNQSTYYDFYDIDSYLNIKEKETLSQINSLKVYYNVDPKDNYNITVIKDNFEVTYRMDIMPSQEEIINNILADNSYNIYLEKDDTFLAVQHFINDNTLLSISIRSTDDISYYQDTLIELMKDSIDLNKQ